MFLFERKKEILFLFLACFVIFLLNFSYKYYEFYKFKKSEFYELNASLEKSEKKLSKKGKSYYLNLFKSDEFSVFLYSKKEIEKGFYALKISTKNVKFKQFLKGQIFSSFKGLKKLQKPQNLASILSQKITAQHENTLLKELFSTLYLATPISRELRYMVTNWGIAHLIAISGFHLGLLFSIFYLLFKKPYEFFQSRFFPFRNRDFDLSVIILSLAGFYLYLLDFAPSFLRSYIMAVFGFFILTRGLKLFNYGNLIICALFAISVNISLLFNIGFYFSCLGVFFILVYIHHFGEKSDLKSKTKMLFHAVFFEIFVFCAMNIPVYFFFNQASLFQMSVIPLGYAFVVFYPLSIFLHLLGFGGVFDEHLLSFLNFASKQGEIFVPLWLFVAFNLSLYFCAKYKKFAIFLAIFSFLYYIYFFIF